ncbi:leucine-rich repeat and immunoglobulin-like domain-containing nogo receptor-interacting protein 1-B [Tribolium madens]|uniref:leucine-rich repeat and immunoglobulin-like domain-containing nogo receptor-interacting protein 1-B n=1 Tax=Tribolium madens TaxID=41895 RepID=UPI001CF75902|nr:leucine-rich repeat and immunoglobulin-like domain-containing nogo receptor-interacting protein 1-B [Tribolium madens]
MRGIVSIILVVLLCYEGKALECTIPNEQRVRFFDSIIHYQGNRIPFSPATPGWQGSSVEFTFNTINKLTKNMFVTYDSEAIISLKLSGKQIKEVENGAFVSLLCLQELLLDHNNITKLEKNIFIDLERLEKLDLSNNRIEVIEDFVFSNLASLKILNLGNNQIEKLQNLAFANLTNLEYLNLERNEIGKIASDLFLPLANLNNLTLAWNMLNVEPEKWHGLAQLRFLDLAANNLDHFDASYNLTFFNLRSLNLSLNSLTQLNVVEIKRHLPHLELIDLNGNPWFCDDLTRIIHELNDSRIKFAARNYTSVAVHGIGCSEVPGYSTRGTTTQIVTTTKKSEEVWVQKDELERYVERKIENNNDKIESSIATLRSFVIFVFALVCLFILFEIIVRLDCCRSVISRLRGGNELYYDNNDVENFRLLGR